MPITFRLAGAPKIVQTNATGIVNFDDLVQHLQAKGRQHVLAYPEIFDTRGAQFDLSILDIGRIADEVRQAMISTHPGALAVVTTSNFIRGLARAYAALTAHDNPAFEIFEKVEDAQSWIGQAAVGSTAGPACESEAGNNEHAPRITTVQ
jgi:hypothetical protein